MSLSLLSMVEFPQWLDVGPVTLDRPFGIRLWPLFDAGFKAVSGQESDSFDLTIGKTPLSTFKDAATLLLLYYTIVFCGPVIQRQRKPWNLKRSFQCYNLLLVFLSAFLFLLFMEQMIQTVLRRGLLFSICELKGGYTDKLVLLYYINYLMKFLELFDTVFLILRKKPLIFLHTYHHGATALLCWNQLTAATAVAWVPISINLFVHIVMYWYYFQASRGIKVWWKRYITQLQITQFIVDIGFIYFALYTGFVSVIWPTLPHWGHCTGQPEAAYIGVAVITSYLFLFMGFYLSTYVSTAENKTMESAQKVKSGFLQKQHIATVVPFVGAASLYYFCLKSSHGLQQLDAYKT